MADIFSKGKRSQIMSRIRSAGTTPERRLYAIVREILGPKRRIDRNVHSLPGRPDVVIPSLKLAMQADGCFYHRCPKHGHEPKTNRDYWLPKLRRNAERDALYRRKLRALGFSVWRIWEHDLKMSKSGRTYAILSRRVIALKRSKSASAGSTGRGSKAGRLPTNGESRKERYR